MLEYVGALLQPWADLYGGSVLLSTIVEFLHLGGLVVAGGFALAFDRAVLRAANGATVQRATFLDELAAVHRLVMIALGVVFASGVALLLADLEALLPSPVFLVKMGALVLLLVNGITIRSAGARLRGNTGKPVGAWTSLRRGAWRSIGLWIALVFLGVLLTSTA